MSHQPTRQPETEGAATPGHAPQVAVRDGNRLLCPCCGQLLMELKAETTSKKFCPPKMTPTKGDPRRTWPSLEKLIARQEAQEAEGFKAYEKEAAQQKPRPTPVQADEPCYRAEAIMVPIDPDIAAYEFPAETPPPITNFLETKRERSEPTEKRDRPMRDVNIRSRERALRRLKQPPKEAWSYESARFHAWIYYRLKVLNIQLIGEVCAKQEVVDGLKQELNAAKSEQPQRTSTGEAPSQNNTLRPANRPSRECVVLVAEQQARREVGLESNSIASQVGKTKERGPP